MASRPDLSPQIALHALAAVANFFYRLLHCPLGSPGLLRLVPGLIFLSACHTSPILVATSTGLLLFRGHGHPPCLQTRNKGLSSAGVRKPSSSEPVSAIPETHAGPRRPCRPGSPSSM